MSDKIKISLDEVNSQSVDDKLKRQTASGRADEHYRERAAAPSTEGFRWSKLLYNSLVFMGLFGLVGGIIAWMFGEVIQSVVSDRREEFAEFQMEAYELREKLILQFGSEEEMASSAVFETRMRALFQRYADNVYVKTLYTSTLDELATMRKLDELVEWDERRAFIQQMMWIAWAAMAMSFFLAIGDQAVGFNMRGVIVNGSVGIVLGLGGGVLVGLFIDKIYNALGGGMEDSTAAQQVLARTVGWTILGAFLAVAPGIVLKNTKRMLIGVAGGVIGGALGGLLFDQIGKSAESAIFSRFVGITAIGVIAGVGTGVIETVAKSGWLRVVSGLIAGKQFVLYKSPTYIGSSPACEIYLFKDFEVHPRHAAIRRTPGGFEIEDLSNGKMTVNGSRVSRQRLKNGDRIQIGSTIFLFHARGRNK